MIARSLSASTPACSHSATDIRGVLVAVVLTAWLGAACATPPETGMPGPPDPVATETWGEVDLDDVEYPDRIGTLALVEVEDYDEPELGVRLKYGDSTRPKTAIDVYLYPITKPDTGSLVYVLDWEIESVAEGMEELAREQGFSAGEAGAFPFGPSDSDDPRGMGVVRTLFSDSMRLRSYAFVAVRDHRFFKLRLTVPHEEMLLDDGYFQELLDILYPAIRLRPPVEIPEIAVSVYANVFLAPQHESCNLQGWIAYGLEMRDQIERGHYLNTFEREYAARRAVLDFWREHTSDGKTCPSDPLEAMSRADEVGFLVEYVYTACNRGGWPEPDGVDLDAWTDWANSNLEMHDPIVDPGVSIEWSSGESEGSDEGGSARAGQ